MKKTIAALVALSAAAALAMAQPPTAADQGDENGFGGHHGRRGPDRAQLLEKYDVNKNGVLDPEEKEAARADWQAGRKEREARMLERFDANHDGKIDDSERAAMKAQREERRAEMLKKYDTDGDGKLSDTEREALRKETREKHGQR